MVIFVSGLSGSGKTIAASQSGIEPIVPLDSYFKNDDRNLPTWLGRTDWETVESYDLHGAVSAVLALLGGEDAEVPIYDHHRNARVGTATVRASDVLVAEGVYAPDLYKAVVAAGHPAVLVHIEVPAWVAFGARIRRDVGERHMNPVWAIIRSLRLAIRHGGYRRYVTAIGAERLTRASAASRIHQLSRF